MKILGWQIEDVHRDPINPDRIWARFIVDAQDDIGSDQFTHQLVLALWVRETPDMDATGVMSALEKKLQGCIDRLVRNTDASQLRPLNTHEATWWH